MTERQKKFVDNYIQTGNATLAAKEAGYSARTASSQGGRMLRNVEVRTEIDKRLKSQEADRVAQTQEILEYLTAVMRGKILEEQYITFGKSYKKVRLPPSTKDRLKAAEHLAKVHGLFEGKLKVELSAPELLIEALNAVWDND